MICVSADPHLVDHVNARDYSRMLDLAVACLDTIDGGDTWSFVGAEMMNRLGCSIGGLTEVGLPTGHTRAPSWFGGRQPTWSRTLANAHPLVRHYIHRRDAAPRTISDVISTRSWRASPVYAAARARLGGATYQLIMPLPGSRNLFRNVALGRPDRDFHTTERSFAARIQPLIVGLDRHLRVINRWQSTLPADPTDVAAATTLTPREMSVLVLLAEGLTATSIARRLGISRHTVSKHQQNVYRKLGVTDRLTAVLCAKELHILK